MPSNQIPEDVRAKALRAVIDVAYPGWRATPDPEPSYDLAVNATAEKSANTIIDSIAPLIIEWARKDQAEVDARIMESTTVPLLFFGADSEFIAPIIRAQFAGETGGER